MVGVELATGDKNDVLKLPVTGCDPADSNGGDVHVVKSIGGGTTDIVNFIEGTV